MKIDFDTASGTVTIRRAEGARTLEEVSAALQSVPIEHLAGLANVLNEHLRRRLAEHPYVVAAERLRGTEH